MAGELLNPDQMGELIDGDASETTEGGITPDNIASVISGADIKGSVRTDELATQLSLIKGQGSDIEAINLARANVSASEDLGRASEELFQQLELGLREAGKGFTELTPDAYGAAVGQLVEGQEQINNMRISPLSAELAVIERATNIPLSVAVKKRLASNLAFRNEMSKMMDDQGKLDFITDIGGMFIPLRQLSDYEDTKEAVGNHPQLRDVIDGDSIQGMISSWQQLSTERQDELRPALVESVLTATGVDYSAGLGISAFKTDKNVLNAVGILLRFLQPEGGRRAEIQTKVLAGLDLLAFGAPVALDLLRVGKSAAIGTAMANLNKLTPSTRKAMEGIMLKASQHARLKNNPIKLIGDAGDKKTAASMNIVAVKDEEVAKAYGMTQQQAYNNTMPMNATSMNPEYIRGLSAESAEIMNDFIRGQQGFVRSMTTESEMLRIGALNASDRRIVIRNFNNEMALKAEDLLLEGIMMTEQKIVPNSINSMGYSFEYTLTNTKQLFIPEGSTDGVPVVTQHTEFRSWRINEQTGNFEETVSDLASASSSSLPGQSPSAWSVTKPGEAMDFNDAIKQSIALADLEMAAKATLNINWLEANKGISGLKDLKARQRIESVEIAGDEWVNAGTQQRGKVFTVEELAAGVPTAEGTVRLTKTNEIEAYYKRRMYGDSIWAMQNFVVRRELELGGFNRSVVLFQQRLAVKPFNTLDEALASAAIRPGFNVFINKNNVTAPLNRELLEQAYDEGQVLVRSRNDWNTTGAGDLARGGEVVEYMLIERNLLRELPSQVLNYKQGYVTKINEGVEFVVKFKRPVTKAGVQGHTVDHALRAFSSKKHADQFVANQVARVLAKHPERDADDVARMFEVADGSKMAQMERMENALSGSGGLFTGTRSADDLLMGLEGVAIPRTSPSEVMGRYIDHMGAALTRNEWRIGQEQQWLNTVKNVLPDVRIQGFGGTALPNTPEGAALGRLRDQIQVANRMPSRTESMMEGMIQRYHDWALDIARGTELGIGKQNIKHALWLKHRNPISALLTANMHVMLGALSPAQLYVQASAAVVGLSLAKIGDVPGIMGQMITFGMMDNIKDATALGKVWKMLIKDGQVQTADIPMYDAWRRSGLLESVRGNADLNYMSSTGLGITQDMIRKSGFVSLYIYRMGELANRRMSFISAYKRWLADNPNKAIGDDELFEIIKESNKTMLELNGANKAWWQRGQDGTAVQRITAMAGQFQQVLAKTVELALKGEKRGGFSAAQKWRIAAGQGLMFGGAGIPILNMIMPGYFDAIGIEPDASTANLVNQGLVGLVVKEMFGADVDIANRAALFSSTLETITDIMTSKDPLWAKLLAVSSSTIQRTFEAGKGVQKVLQSQALLTTAELEPLLLHNRAGETEMEVPTMLQTASDIARILGAIPSSGRNLLKARMMHNSNRILDRRANVTIEDDFSWNDEIGVALGFRLTRETSLQMTRMGNREIEEEVQAAAQVIIRAHHEYVFLHEFKDEYAQVVKNIQQLVHESLDSPYKINRVSDIVANKIFADPKTTEERELKKFYERQADKVTSGVISDTSVGFGNVLSKQAIVQPLAVTDKDNK